MSRPVPPTDDQPALPLSLQPTEDTHPCSHEALKAAYTRARLWPRYTFEQALADPAIATALRCSAEAASKHRRGQA